MNIPLTITGSDLKIDDVVDVARGRPVGLDEAVVPRLERSRRALEQLVADGAIAYGITTGFGHFKDKIISPDQTRQLQLNLVRSHAVGVGPLLPAAVVRAMLLVRANTLALGYSGVRPVSVQRRPEMLNCGVHPVVPAPGSLGASGDLAPLAHLALVLIGEGEAEYEGERLPGAEAMRRAGLEPVTLEAKEGL